MDAWSTRLDRLCPDVGDELARIASEPAALTTITNLAPLMVQPPPPKAPQAVQAFIKNQCGTRRAMIEALEAEITALNSIHNILFPYVTTLPPEMLAEVFSYLRNHHLGQRPNPDFSNAMATCKKWREVGCGVARFWTRIPLHNPNLLAASLERSQRLPLSLYLEDRPCPDVQGVVELIRPHTGRIKAVDISHSDGKFLRALCSTLDRPAPMLQSLRIRYSGTTETEVDPHTPFGGNMPALRSLALDRVLLAPNTLWTSNLRELSMRDTSPSLSVMLAFLQQCTSLRILRVDGYHTWADDDTSPDDPPVSLPSLWFLDMRTQPVVASEDLFAHLILPETAAVRLEVDLHTDERPVLLPDLRLSPGIPCIRGLKRLEIKWQDIVTDEIVISGFRNATGLRRPDFEVVIRGAHDFFDLPDEWYLDTSEVESFWLCLGGLGELSYDSWDILQRFPNLTSFRLSYPDTPSLVSLMGQMTETMEVPNHPSQRVHRLCRHLQTLELVSFRWSEEVETIMQPMMVSRQMLEPRALRHVDMYNVQGGPATSGRYTIGTADAPQTTVVANIA